MTLMTFVALAGGIVALVLGAEWMVRGAASLAARTGLSPVVIGLTVVAFGTSAPELAVSLGAAMRDQADLAIGNVVGSNIANVLLVLGLAALVGGGLSVAQRIIRIDVPLVIGVSILVFVFALDRRIDRIEGIVLILILVAYIIWTVLGATRDRGPRITDDDRAALEHETVQLGSAFTEFAYVIAGIVLLVIGAQALVVAATDVATELGVSELVIGLTVVAVGTSLPEIATSVLAAMRGERDLAVGNAVGSNLFNLLAVLGLTATFSPRALVVLDGAVTVDLPVMIAAAVACLPLFATGYLLARWEGGLFFAYYLAYLIWLLLDATGHDLRTSFAWAMIAFVLPLTGLTLGVIGWREFRRRRGLI